MNCHQYRKISGSLLLCGLLLTLAGCADPVVFSELFQQEKDQKIYTAYNLWFDKSGDISSFNIQKGQFLPAGTEIIPVKTTKSWQGGKIIFQDVKGHQFTIHYDRGVVLKSMGDYILDTFSTTPPAEWQKTFSQWELNLIRQGQVKRGMSRKGVLRSYGPPPPIRTPNRRNLSWIYWIDENRTIRVMFEGDQVSGFFDVDAFHTTQKK